MNKPQIKRMLFFALIALTLFLLGRNHGEANQPKLASQQTPVSTTTPRPTQTPSPLPTATQGFVQVVQSRDVITAENAGEVTELQRLGLGMALELDISPDDSMLAVASTTGIQVYALKTQAMLFHLSDNRSESVDWSPDSQRLASVHNDGTLKIWGVPEKKMETSKRVTDGPLYAVAWSPDGEMIATNGPESLIIWDSETLALIAKFEAPRSGDIEWSSDNKHIGFHDAAIIFFLDIENGEVTNLVEDGIGPFIGDGYFVNGANPGATVTIFGKDSRTHATGDGFSKRFFRLDREELLFYDGNLNKYNIKTGEKKMLMAYDWGRFSRLMEWTTDLSIFVSGSIYGELTIIDLNTTATIGTIPGYYCCFNGLVWSPENNKLGIATDTAVKNVFIWDLLADEIIPGESQHYERSYNDYIIRRIHYIGSMVWGYGNELMISNNGESSKTLVVWNAFTGKLLFEIRTPDGNKRINGPAQLSPTGAYLSYQIYSPEKLIVLEIQSRRTILRIEIDECAKNHFWSPDSQLIALTKCDDQGVEIWDVAGQVQIAAWKLSGLNSEDAWLHEIKSLAWSSDNNYLAGRNRAGHLWVWDAFTGEDIFSIEEDDYERYFSSAIAWSPKSHLLAVNLRDGVALWDMETNIQVALTDNFDGGIQSIVWSADGTQFATIGDDHTIRIWGIP
ncbi:MAG: WD40 repeat domain-containing protein [Anaerolineae bacterium]|nr:WD40 repeat domain-containing protein [Anaerolineae bacterium]